MANALLPWPVALGWAVAFGLLFVVHLDHAESMTGQHRLWHAGHALTALGMLVMYLPTPTMVVPPLLGAVVFLAAVVGLVVVLVAAVLRGFDVGLVWLITMVELVWMAYMFDAMHRPAAVWSLVGAAWFLAQAFSCGSGRPGLVLGPGLGRTSSMGAAPVVAARRSAGSGGDPVLVLDRSYRKTMRLSMTVMALGMTYMLLAMQFGMSVLNASGGEMAGLHHH